MRAGLFQRLVAHARGVSNRVRSRGSLPFEPAAGAALTHEEDALSPSEPRPPGSGVPASLARASHDPRAQRTHHRAPPPRAEVAATPVASAARAPTSTAVDAPERVVGQAPIDVPQSTSTPQWPTALTEATATPPTARGADRVAAPSSPPATTPNASLAHEHRREFPTPLVAGPPHPPPAPREGAPPAPRGAQRERYQAPAAASTASAPAEIHVHIGRIEVARPTPPRTQGATPGGKRREAQMSLDAYLEHRRRGER